MGGEIADNGWSEVDHILDPRNEWHLLGRTTTGASVYYTKTKKENKVAETDVNRQPPIPRNYDALEVGPSDPDIDRLMEAQGYVGAEYRGKDPETGNLYYHISGNSNLKVIFVPSHGQVYAMSA